MFVDRAFQQGEQQAGSEQEAGRADAFRRGLFFGSGFVFVKTAFQSKQKLVDKDIIAILITIILQDIPFICLRLTLILGWVLH